MGSEDQLLYTIYMREEARARARSAETANVPPAPPFVVGWQEEETTAKDDDQSPIWTFRVLLLGSISFLFLLILNKYILQQTGEWLMAMESALAVLYPLGYVMGKVVRRRTVYYPTFGLEFCTNPGPFSLREYAIISVIANVGASIGGFTSHYVDWLYS